MASTTVDVKVVLLGAPHSGKTSLVERFLHNRFFGEQIPYQTTIGAAYGVKRVVLGRNTVVMGLWDTAGSERYRAISRIYYRSSFAALIAVDLTDSKSLLDAQYWIAELRGNEPECRVVLVGTKLDIVKDNPPARQISSETAMQLSRQYTAPYFETSARSGSEI